MNHHNFILEPYAGIKTRHHCVNCGKRELTLYIDVESKEYLSEYVGRCNRETSCGYHFTPKEYFLTNGIKTDFTTLKKKPALVIKQTSLIEQDVFVESLKDYDKNNFITFLIMLFGMDAATKLIETYYIGTGSNGNTIYWQINTDGEVRTGKIMMYDPVTGKRLKGVHNHINWVHSKIDNFNLNQCLFGEHLLKNNRKPCALVESEKTAIIASVYLPQYTWLATGGLNNLKLEKCQALKGRNVILFPDLGGFEKWSIKAQELKSICNVTISNILEENASDDARKAGYDIADYLVKFKPEEFQRKKKYEEYSKLERLQFGLSIFRVEDLRILAKQVAEDWVSYRDVMINLQNDGMTYTDAEDILDVMCIRKVLKVGDFQYRVNYN